MKTILKSKYWILALFFMAIGILGCNESYLEVEDTTSISSDNYPTTLEQVGLLVTSVYGEQHEWGFLGHYWFGYGEYCLDHTIDFEWRGTESWIGIATGSAELGDSKLVRQWVHLYRGIYFANSALDGINEYREIATSSEEEELNYYEGECLFFRAFYLWHLLQFYGQPNLDGMGVPVITKVPTDLESMYVSRASTEDTYQAIINDFKAASELLVGQNDNTRATEWSAKAGLAKAYFFAEKTDSAKIYLEDCINNSGKSLVSYDFYKNMFNGNISYENNSESFYETSCSVDEDGSAYGSAMVGSSLSILYSHFYIAADGQRTATSYSNLFMHDRNLARFGYNDNAPLSEIEQVNGEWQLKEDYVEQQLERRTLLGQQEDGPDPRLYVCAMQPFIDTVTVGGEEYPVAQGEFGNCYTMDQSYGNDSATFQGWPTRKYQYLDGKMTEVNNNAGYNIYFIRLPDIYLMYAELLEDSDPATALEYVNKVHRRAYGYAPDSPSEVDYSSLSDRTKAASDDHLANNPLLYERWAELFAEGRWWEDVRRLRLGDEEADYYQVVAQTRTITWRDEHYAMPIPVSEIESNESMEQNPGYD